MALQLGACAASCAGWCCCSSIGSLLSACCGNDKPSTISAGPSSGRKRSVALVVLSVCLQLVFQFALAPYILDNLQKTNIIRKAWLNGCDADANVRSCIAVGGNFRVASATTLFFLFATIAAYCKPTANREAWPAKIMLYLIMVACTVVIPNEPYFNPIYLVVAIVGGVIFICLQQVVILDCSYNWNDSWVENSNKAEQEEVGSGKKWLFAILTFCAIFFLGAFGGLIYMFFEFTGCATNNTFISLTLIFCILLPIAQLTGGEGNLLSVACISAWATFLCYTAIIKNPNDVCNPKIGESSPVSVTYGLLLSLISLGWAGWSYTANEKLSDTKIADNTDDIVAETPVTDGDVRGKRDVTGIVVVTQSKTDATMEENYMPVDEQQRTSTENVCETNPPSKSSNAWRLNVALAVVSCWCAVTLTQWGVVQSNDGTIANRNVGYISMWVIIGSQWLVMTLYLWTLIAPRLFPNRDFS